MITQVRIFGGELGEPRGYIDCDIVGVTNDGSLVLREQDKEAEWTMDFSRLVSLFGDDLAYDMDEIDATSEVWKAIDGLEARFEKDSTEDKTHYENAARCLFRGAE